MSPIFRYKHMQFAVSFDPTLAWIFLYTPLPHYLPKFGNIIPKRRCSINI
uniref:Uncharacterized protein n=1 Tax=Nymphaea colorata TaxID=210225 RepID=A0A5K0YFT0_9MAGN|nr:unnamed protein product [Nymphaea colorata]